MKLHTKWQAPFELFEQLDKESVKLLFDLAEKRLKSILETTDRTTNRTYTVLTATIPLIAFLFSLLFKHYLGGADSTLSYWLLRACWLTVFIFLLSDACLLRVAFPRNMHQIGREPKLLFTETLIADENYKEDKQAKMLLICEIEDLQERIDFMQAQSNYRVTLFKRVIYLMSGYALFCFLILLVVVIFR